MINDEKSYHEKQLTTAIISSTIAIRFLFSIQPTHVSISFV